MRIGPESALSADWTVWDVTMRRHDGQGKPPARAEAIVDLTVADDRTLVKAFLDGRRDAFDVIVERHRRNVYHLCYRFVANHEDASDLAQDVFVRAFKGLRHFKGDSSLGTWLYRVSVNVCLNRAAVKRPVIAPIEAAPAADPRAIDPLARVVQGERAEVVRLAIAQLPPKQRATVMLRVYQELSHEEISRILGTSVGAVKANFFHALGNLRRILKSS
jgi:RNA polymerase sigma-70 factor (ECF subfamily)